MLHFSLMYTFCIYLTLRYQYEFFIFHEILFMKYNACKLISLYYEVYLNIIGLFLINMYLYMKSYITH